MQSKKILVIQTAFIGDAILTLPLIQKLKSRFPESLIDVIAIPKTEEIFQSSSYVNEVIILDKRGTHKSISSILKFSKFIKEKKYDAIYSPHRSVRSAFIVMQSGVKETFGFNTSSWLHVYRTLAEYDINKHEVERNFSLLGLSPEEDWRILPEIKADQKISEKINSLIIEKSLSQGFVAIAPGSVWKTKRYPKENFKKIIFELNKNNIKVVLIGGSDDADLCDQLNDTGNTISFAGQLSVIESIELLKHASLLITNDSAPTHMGMAADIPVLTLYCSTVPGFGFFPYNKKSKSISFDELKCKPCGIHGYEACPLKHFDCGIKLTPDLVMKEALQLLDINRE
ncbi:MAG: glycosyltransferase family 9 protein [Ignavibacteriales bacterium]|nr:MAG: glycosyltransferase family 9 protein [Ignavibacteriales bacterium]